MGLAGSMGGCWAKMAATRAARGSWRAALASRQMTAAATIRAQATARSSSQPCCRSLLEPMLCANATGQHR